MVNLSEYQDELKELRKAVQGTSMSELNEIRQRVIGGWVDGGRYIHTIEEGSVCGCVYGTVYIVLHGESFFAGKLDVDEEEGVIRAFKLEGRAALTALERFAFEIYLKDTPDTSDNSAALLAMVDAVIAERQNGSGNEENHD